MYGVLNAILYASLLPLWDGFDEPFHYSYVQTLSEQHAFPQLGRTLVSTEVWTSLHLAPASHVVQHNLPWVTTFEDYFRMSRSERLRRRAQLERLPRENRFTGGLNHEAQQAPLAYAILALFDRAWYSAALPARIWGLRLICSLLAVVITVVFLSRLARRLRVPPRFEAALIFGALSSQMFYATTAHVANDWLAVALMSVLFERLVALHENPSLRQALALTVVLAAGVLTKAYFLAFLPLIAVAIVRLAMLRRLRWVGALLSLGMLLAAGGPWYLRNLRLYRSLGGMQETVGGADWLALAGALIHLPWIRSIRNLAFAGQWTGNNSFNSFSWVTLSMLLAGLAAAAVLYVVDVLRRRTVPGDEIAVLCGCACYGCALLFSTAVNSWFTRGAYVIASPWYLEPLMPIVLLLLFAALARSGRLGAGVARWIVAWSAYIILATYWAKLIPYYAGYSGRMTPLALLHWYGGGLSPIDDILSTTALGPPALIWGLASIVSGVVITLSVAVISSLRWPAAAGNAAGSGPPDSEAADAYDISGHGGGHCL
ncbi:MAG: hypothetical protein ACLQBJ_12550 [Bryobacteraceae bacterium]